MSLFNIIGKDCEDIIMSYKATFEEHDLAVEIEDHFCQLAIEEEELKQSRKVNIRLRMRIRNRKKKINKIIVNGFRYGCFGMSIVALIIAMNVGSIAAIFVGVISVAVILSTNIIMTIKDIRRDYVNDVLISIRYGIDGI